MCIIQLTHPGIFPFLKVPGVGTKPTGCTLFANINDSLSVLKDEGKACFKS